MMLVLEALHIYSLVNKKRRKGKQDLKMFLSYLHSPGLKLEIIQS
jgi:hypothetical protein